MNVLKNCPNCGGTLQDDGRCRFCGSKVYDFVNINFNNPAPTYIRFKQGDQIVTYPVIFHSTEIRIEPCDYQADPASIVDFPKYIRTIRRSGILGFDVLGDGIVEVQNDE